MPHFVSAQDPDSVRPLSIATFDIDATPPVGSMMAYDPVTNKWDLGLRARGIILIGAGEPIVLCAIDWIGLANESHDVFREQIAKAADTVLSRVAVHALHQHDAPESDFSAEKLLKEAGHLPRQYEGTFQRETLSNLVAAVKIAKARAQPVTHIGLGEAAVEKVASNRRIMGPDGKVRAVRWTATTDKAIRDEPEGLVDPIVSLISFWNGDKSLALLSYYATHPQSYYRTGIPNPDFPGVARFGRQLAIPGALHVHFTGAGGNIGVGKYNDGNQANRGILAERLGEGMRLAFETTRKERITAADVTWKVEPVALPVAKHLVRADLETALKESGPAFAARNGPTKLAWVKRVEAGHKIEISCLGIGKARVLHMPGELFVEYQLASKAMRPDLFVAMAAYGDYAPFYIGVTAAYDEGGYETGPDASNVSPEVEPILMKAMERLLK
ncbi:MAG: hypothetical protein ACO1QB_05065 [Verrucomicrobiales bacterium]